MLAPIALYPDDLLAQILMASSYPLEVVQAARWSRSHPGAAAPPGARDHDRWRSSTTAIGIPASSPWWRFPKSSR